MITLIASTRPSALGYRGTVTVLENGRTLYRDFLQIDRIKAADAREDAVQRIREMIARPS